MNSKNMKTATLSTTHSHHGRRLFYISVLVSFLIALGLLVAVQTSEPHIQSSHGQRPRPSNPRHLLSTDLHSDPMLNSSISNLTTLNINESTIAPLLDPDHHRVALQRLHNGTGEIVLFHARKAGGTTMSSWMEQLSRR